MFRLTHNKTVLIDSLFILVSTIVLLFPYGVSVDALLLWLLLVVVCFPIRPS